MGYALIIAGIISIIAGVNLVLKSESESESEPTYSFTLPDSKPAIAAPVYNPEPAAPSTVSAESVQEEEKPLTPKEKGDAFENFVCDLLADWRLKLLDRTTDAVSSAGVVAESCKNPDLHVQQKFGKSDIDYFLECKYRSSWRDDCVTFEAWQIERYRQFQRANRRKVVFAVGIGGTPSAPETFLLVPLDSLIDNSIRRIDTKYVVVPSPDGLVSYMDNYFNSVFAQSRAKKAEARKKSDK